MSFSFAFSLGPWLGAMLLERHGPQALWGIALVSGCISALLMSRIGLEKSNVRKDPALAG
jgi:predicted MFS family arabinose efflux permease